MQLRFAVVYGVKYRSNFASFQWPFPCPKTIYYKVHLYPSDFRCQNSVYTQVDFWTFCLVGLCASPGLPCSARESLWGVFMSSSFVSRIFLTLSCMFVSPCDCWYPVVKVYTIVYWHFFRNCIAFISNLVRAVIFVPLSYPHQEGVLFHLFIPTFVSLKNIWYSSYIGFVQFLLNLLLNINLCCTYLLEVFSSTLLFYTWRLLIFVC